MCGQFLYPEGRQKQTFFDALHPHFVHVVIEWPLTFQWDSTPLTSYLSNVLARLLMFDFHFPSEKPVGFKSNTFKTNELENGKVRRL